MERKKYPVSFWVLAVLIMLLIAAAVFAPVLAPNDPNKSSLMDALKGPCQQFPLGTDPLGRCLLSRMLYGGRVSIFSSLIITASVFVLGTVLGVFSGYTGGAVDMVLTKIISITQAFPKIILAIAIAGVLGIGIKNTIIALCIVEWAEYARMARSLTRSVKERTFIKAAKICGCGEIKIMCMEVAALSYLGVGVQSPMAEWGAMMNTGKDYSQTNISLVLVPGAAIFITAVIFNLFGEKIRDVLGTRN